MKYRTILGIIAVSIPLAIAGKKSLEGPLASQDHWAASDTAAMTAELAAAIQDIKPRDSRYLARAGELLLDAGQTAQAEKTFASALAADVKDDEACRIIAVAYRNKEMWSKADEWFKRATELDPGDVDHVAEWGIACWRRGDKAKAAELFTRILSAEPDTARLYYKIGAGIGR